MAIRHVRVFVSCLRIVQFLACDATDAVVPGESNPEMYLLLRSFLVLPEVRLSSRSLPEFSSFFFFQTDYFGLSHNSNHNLTEAEQQC